MTVPREETAQEELTVEGYKELMRLLVRFVILEAMKGKEEMFVQDLIGKVFSSPCLERIGYKPETPAILSAIREMYDRELISCDCECCKDKRLSPEEMVGRMASITLTDKGREQADFFFDKVEQVEQEE